MNFFISTLINKIAQRITGPMNFRFVLQPLAAISLGIRDGLMDAKAKEPPFIFDFIFNAQNRKKQIIRVLGSLLRPIILSIVLDTIAQYLIFKKINIIGAVIVGTFVMGVPYSIARGLTNRIVTAKNNNKK